MKNCVCIPNREDGKSTVCESDWCQKMYPLMGWNVTCTLNEETAAYPDNCNGISLTCSVENCNLQCHKYKLGQGQCKATDPDFPEELNCVCDSAMVHTCPGEAPPPPPPQMT